MYVERLRKQGLYEFSYEPKSFWEYSRGNNIDKLVDDIKSYDHNKVAQKDFLKQGRGSFLSKFNSEYAKRIIEMWTKEDDFIVDPFAGRSSRPLVSTLLKRNYVGFDVVYDNLQEAKEQYDILKKGRQLGYLKLIHTSSEYMDLHLNGGVADMIITCPPYFNIEKYESVDGQLTDIKIYKNFLDIYKTILEKSANILKPGCFFAIVVANFRIDGELYDFCSDTKDILKKHLTYHDEIILEMSPAKRHPLYTQAITNLNCLKTHEYCLVFRKEDNKENLIKRNNDINWNRPLVKDIHPNKERLFWVDKKDWIDDKFGVAENSLDRFE
jgi:DNA modification methylase|tara:strand:- start:583 stop:1560 length:978 start_codon:yes stop_codon:yes gene_type:complete